MRDKFSEIIFKNSQRNKNIVIVAADISPSGKMAKLQKGSSSFINVGVAEQSMIGVCAGLAIGGKKPFAYTIATFSLYRPFEMIRNDLCYQNLPVTIVGMGSGTTYSTLGGTHLSTEDISIARSLHNMRIIAPCDPLELEDAVNFCCKNKTSPIYLRIGKSGEKNFTNNSKEKWTFGKIRKVLNGNKTCILTYGPIIKLAFKVNQTIKEKISIYSCHTLKPFDEKRVKTIMKKYNKILVLEDHSKIGGLSEIILAEGYKNKYKGKIISFSLKDQFINCYGSQSDLQEKHGISVKKIINALK